MISHSLMLLAFTPLQVCGPGQPKDLREIVSDFPDLGEVDYIQHGVMIPIQIFLWNFPGLGVVHRYIHKGKNLVSDGHFCKSFCPAQPKISISSDLKHYYHLLAYPDWVMSEIHDLLQNRILRNQLLMAASVMEFPSTTLKNVPVEKILLQN